jgi:hypothetical protein
MGQDASIILVAKRVTPATSVDTARQAFQGEPPQNLVVLYGDAAPPSVKAKLPDLTSLSLWADAELTPAPFAIALSRSFGPVLVVTMADHSCTGGWQVFEGGVAGTSVWTDGDDYCECGITGVERAFRVQLLPDEEERLSFVEYFLTTERGLCVFGQGGVLTPGRTLSLAEVTAIIEYDLPEAELECLLLQAEPRRRWWQIWKAH